MWHRRLWLIDHGAALYFHHALAAVGAGQIKNRFLERSRDAFSRIKDHVLLPRASRLEAADVAMSARLLVPDVLHRILDLIPGAWLADESTSGLEEPEEVEAKRNAYGAYLLLRLEEPRSFVEEAIRARESNGRDAKG
jgi:hypothetical protein